MYVCTLNFIMSTIKSNETLAVLIIANSHGGDKYPSTKLTKPAKPAKHMADEDLIGYLEKPSTNVLYQSNTPIVA